MTEQDKDQLNLEIGHIFESGVNHERIFNMVEMFINKRHQASTMLDVSISLERAKKYARHQHFLGTQGKDLVVFEDWASDYLKPLPPKDREIHISGKSRKKG